MKIKVYSTPTCPWCLLAKKYFDDKKIAYESIDVAADQKKAQEMVEISGQLGVPVITIERDDNDTEPTVIVGFDKEAIEKAIEKKN